MNHIRRKYPHQWKSLKKNWEQVFSKAEVTVTAKLTIKKLGLTSALLMLKENEIKK
ncbi:Ger(x)C family spore germination C-terminal domain-containing protein [Paenibacillus solisilvae]|uniref:Ger(X)C family spore germination C-terminal domain-containing protein n=1 Tax=Paenibacillus solisilvae TaxID=2486751 RepID=A0ABW0VYI2_9BACL